MSSVDPELAAVLAEMPEFVFDAETLPTIRTLMPGPALPPGDLERFDHALAGDACIRLTVHRPRRTPEPLPCVYWVHGGGLVAGNRHMDDAQLERWCRALSCVSVAVEYRLAPEHRYPAALDDCAEGFTWVTQHAEQLGVDPAHIGVGGRSAGGGLAAALALRARDESGTRPSFLYLEYPMLDDRQQTPSSRLDGLPLWTKESNAVGWRSYLGDRVGTDDVPEFAAPARAADLTGLPATCVIVGGIDGLRDESVEFAARLMRAGVPTELHVYPGAPHGFHLFADAGVTRRANADVDDWLRRQFQQPHE
jgi:acetyl esterase/lipase